MFTLPSCEFFTFWTAFVFSGAFLKMKEVPISGALKTKVDDEDFEYVSSLRLYANKDKNTTYVAGYEYVKGKSSRKNGLKLKLLHRMLLGITDRKIEIDHIDGDGLNNCKSNLRPCTKSDNQKNRTRKGKGASKFIGVSRHGIKWRAYRTDNKKHIHIGLFFTEDEAALAYNDSVKKSGNTFYVLNDI